MDYIPPVFYDDEYLHIPFVEGNRYCKFNLKEGDEWESLFERHCSHFIKCAPFCKYQVFSIFEENEETQDFCVYQMKDIKEEEVFVITHGEWEYHDFEDFTAVCIPQNRFSLLKFYRENLIPFCQKGYLIS